jgi:hypothetical protein
VLLYGKHKSAFLVCFFVIEPKNCFRKVHNGCLSGSESRRSCSKQCWFLESTQVFFFCASWSFNQVTALVKYMMWA